MENVLIVGSGLQAQRRAASITKNMESRIVGIVGVEIESLQKLGKIYNVPTSLNFVEEIAVTSASTVLITTPTSLHFEIAALSLTTGKNVFCEKPLVRTLSEARDLERLSRKYNRKIACGFNLRFHPAIRKALEHIRSGQIGKLLYGRGVYGFGRRNSHEQEWRSDSRLTLNGHLTEQGIHLLDLAALIFGQYTKIQGVLMNKISDNTDTDDGGAYILRFEDGTFFTAHSTLAEWINRFELEVIGTTGSIKVVGLGNSYGVESIELVRAGEGPFTREVIEYRSQDSSFDIEWESYLDYLRGLNSSISNLDEATRTISMVELAYRNLF